LPLTTTDSWLSWPSIIRNLFSFILYNKKNFFSRYLFVRTIEALSNRHTASSQLPHIYIEAVVFIWPSVCRIDEYIFIFFCFDWSRRRILCELFGEHNQCYSWILQANRIYWTEVKAAFLMEINRRPFSNSFLWVAGSHLKCVLLKYSIYSELLNL
jgi:hypothetical protein